MVDFVVVVDFFVVDDEVVDVIVVVVDGVVVDVVLEVVVLSVEEVEVEVEVMVEVVVGDFVVVNKISASVVLGRGLGPAEVLSVFIKPRDSVVSLSFSSFLSSSSDRMRSI